MRKQVLRFRPLPVNCRNYRRMAGSGCFRAVSGPPDQAERQLFPVAAVRSPQNYPNLRAATGQKRSVNRNARVVAVAENLPCTIRLLLIQRQGFGFRHRNDCRSTRFRCHFQSVYASSETQTIKNLCILNTQDGQFHIQIVELGLRGIPDLFFSDECWSIRRHLYAIVSPKRHPKVEISRSTPFGVLI